MSYLDIDVILAEEDRIPCVFASDVADLGHLDPANASNTLPAGSRIELPLWLAVKMMAGKVVDMDLPKHYGKKMRDELFSSSLINLRDYSHYFFNVGMKLGHATKDDDLLRSIRVAFCGERFKTLLVQSLTKDCHDDVTEYAHTLTDSELQLLKEGLSVSKEMVRWRNRQSHILETSALLARDAASSTSSSSASAEQAAKRARTLN